MARPKSDDKRDAIMAAAIRVISAQGLSAATAAIAKEAGVANGSLFNYFPTKVDLLNHLYCELKAEMASAALDGLPAKGDVRRQGFHVWSQWLRWTTTYPEKRRTLTHLGVSDDVTMESRTATSRSAAEIAELLNRCREGGPMHDVPLGFVLALMNAVAEATTDFMARDPVNAEKHCKVGFDALWRMIT